jgi:TAP-like protein
MQTRDAALDRIEHEWGAVAGLSLWTPSLVGDERLREAWARLSRASVSPKSARALMQMGYQVDWAEFVPAVHVPTLVLHRAADLVVPASAGRELAQRLPEASYVELPGSDHLFWLGDQDALLAEVQSFLTGARPIDEPDRVLTTILFTDVVGSTELAARLGDRRWRELLDDHDQAVREQLVTYRGREVMTAGDCQGSRRRVRSHVSGRPDPHAQRGSRRVAPVRRRGLDGRSTQARREGRGTT